jgi:hypothetical protein
MSARLLPLVCLIWGAAVVGSEAAWAQEPFNVVAPVDNLATLFTDLYGPDGLIVDSLATLPGQQPHNAHFLSDFQANFSQFSTALVDQLVTVPLPSPASSYTFEFDPTVGIFQRSTQSFGPILTERAETVGAGRLAFGSAYQRFTFDSIEGLDLGQIPSVFQHDDAELLGGREDVVTTVNSIQATVAQLTTFLTVGVTDDFDVSVAVPIISNDIKVVSDATIQRLGTTDPMTHFFVLPNGEVGNRRIFTAIGSSDGLGDVTIRLKDTVSRRVGSLAVALDVRIPTGDAMDLLGSGAAGLRPFVIWSGTFQRLSPHLNVGYQWNGPSILAGDPASGRSADFPDEIVSAAGADVGVNNRVTLAFDVLSRYVLDGKRLQQQTFYALDGVSTFPNIAFVEDSFSTMRGSVGAKTALGENLLLDLNLLFALDERGLNDRVTSLVGIEYSFR